MTKTDGGPTGTSNRFSTGIAILVAIGLVVSLYIVLQIRTSNADEHVREGLIVTTATFQQQQGYQRQSRYLGAIVAAERSSLSFEVGGRLATSPLLEGTVVEAGQVIASLDDKTLSIRRDGIVANYEQVKADLALAKLREKRQKSLLDKKSISQDVYDETRLTVVSLQARAESVRANLASIELDIEKSRLLAPFRGVVADRFLSKGAVVAAGTPIVRLIASGTRYAHIGVSSKQSKTLVVGQSYMLDLRDQPVTAELIHIRPDIDPITRSTVAIFSIPETVSAIDGDTVNLLLEQEVNIVGGWLPLSALQEGKRGIWTVLRIEPSENIGEFYVVREAVQVLELQGDSAYVQGTLKDGDRVVSTGLHRLIPGSKVRPQGS